MDGKYFYELMQDQISTSDKRVLLSNMTPEQKAMYNKYSTKMRQQKFMSNKQNKEKYNEMRRIHIAKLREEKPEEMKEQNRKDVKNHNMKKRAISTLTNAVKNMKARKEMKELKKLKEDSIKTNPEKKKRGRPKGSKNKPKTAETKTETEKKKRGRPRKQTN